MAIKSPIQLKIFSFIFLSVLLLSCQEDKIDPDAYDIPKLKGQKGPVVYELSPSSGVAGTQVVISGKFFSPRPQDNTVLFNGIAAVVLEASPFVLVVEAPAGAGSGPVKVMVRGRESNSNVIFTYESSLNVVTFAGSIPGYVDGPLAQARFSSYSDMESDGQGNFYVLDRVQHAVRKISADGIVSTLAGGAGPGHADGTGSEVQFNYPEGIAIDLNGDLIISEYLNQTIRRVTPEGVVTTIAGVPGEWGYVDGPAATAMFDSPMGIDVDNNGNIIIAEYMNHRIRMITPSGIVSTIAGSGPLAYDGGGHKDGAALESILTMPRDVVVADNGDIYITETSDVIRKLSAGMISTVAGSPQDAGFADGPAAEARFYNVYGIDIGADNSLYVADLSNNRIRKITADGIVSTFAGTGEDTSVDGPIETATFNQPRYVHFGPEGALYVMDASSRIRKIQ
jgi:sugar lactone lactonase YvrE